MSTNLNNGVGWHPHFNGYSAETTRSAVVWDFTLSTTEQYLVPINYAVWALDAEGQRYRHYKNDSTLVTAREGDFYSPNVIRFRNKEAAEKQGFKFSLRLKQWFKESDPEFYGDETLLQYHSDARADYTKPEDDWACGVEVEKEDRRYRADEKVWRLFQNTGWVKERDGSLGDNGWELISPVMPMSDLTRLKKICHPVRKYLNAEHSARCGGHINLSRKGWTSNQILERLKDGFAFLYAIYPNRMTNSYCRAKSWQTYIDMPDKYSALYKKNNRIVEIRLFPAIKNYKNLLWRVTLLKVLTRRHFGFIEKVESLENHNSYLYVHLSSIYTPEKIREITQRAINIYSRWMRPFTEAEKQVLRGLGYSLDGSTTNIPAVDEEIPDIIPAGERS